MEGGGVQSHLRAIFDLQSLQDQNSLQDQKMSHENRTSRGMVCEGERGGRGGGAVASYASKAAGFSM